MNEHERASRPVTFREGEAVRVIKGNDAGKTGTVVVADPETDWYAVEILSPDKAKKRVPLYQSEVLQRIKG